MGQFFSNQVEQALEYIYYDLCAGKGNEGMLLLEEASLAAGDGDASCLLARCFCGYQYVWSGHKFPKDDNQMRRLLQRSIQQGSALGVLVAMGISKMTSWLLNEMPFADLKEPFDIVLKKAQKGEPFCQYVIGNIYFQRDFMRIDGITRDSFTEEAEFNRYMSENIAKCESWFWKAFRGGMFFAGNNLNLYYTKGDTPYVIPEPEKAKGLWRIGAELGYPVHQYILASELEKAGQYTEALRWYKAAARGKEPGAWRQVGKFYENGIGVTKNIREAIDCYKAGEREGDISCYRPLDALLRRG